MSTEEFEVERSEKDRWDDKQLKEENRRLHRAVDELAVLNDLALAIGGSLNSEKIMRTIIGRSIRAVEAEQGDITLIDEDDKKPAHTLVRSMVSSSNRSPLHLNQNLLGWIQIHKKPLMINDPSNDSRFQNVSWEASIDSVLSAPLMVKSKLIGMLTVYNKKSEPGFTESDQRLLSIIAAQSAQVVENARLYEEEQEYKLVQREMELASNIQKQLLPSTAPAIQKYELGGRNLTAKSVGGDYYDFIQMDEQRWAVCLGDISGKGLPASLLMANLQAILRGQTLHLNDPAELLKYANYQLYQSTDTGSFATLFLGILDTASHTLQYSSGGHEPPFLIRRDGSHIRLEEGGIPLGVMEEHEYKQAAVEVKEGDLLVVYSDGITDSMNPSNEEFGEGRLQELLLSDRLDRRNPESVIDMIFKASTEHSGRAERFDDMTAVVLLRNP